MSAWCPYGCDVEIARLEASVDKLEDLAKVVRLYLEGPYPDGKNPEELIADIKTALSKVL